ncbi:unnamed protein product [Cuscuta campestris]|uniref:Uncharacterized protein n=1 Tax=Cuscuta campestris TaxID=132261 RepID=A0A484MWU2_9ASTE|nr:unnamed protein product [Cuscuta campestris]
MTTERVVLISVLEREKTRFGLKIEFYAFDEGLFRPYNKSGDDSLALVSGTDAGPTPLVAKHISLLDHCHNGASLMAHKSRVYLAGGYNSHCNPCKDAYRSDDNDNGYDVVAMIGWGERCVFCLDTTKGSEWTTLPSMTYGRWSPHLHVIDGVLYAVGGMRNEGAKFMEMLPEAAEEWVTLPNPPSHIKLDFKNFSSIAVVGDDGDSHILFGSWPDRFYTYTPKSKSWVAVEPLSSSGISGMPLHVLWGQGFMLDKAHFVHLGNNLVLPTYSLVCYNVQQGCQYPLVDLVREELLPLSLPFALLELVDVGGGELALLYADYDDYGTHSCGYYCCRFTVNLDRASAGLDCCSVISTRRCIAPKSTFSGALALDIPAHFPKGKHYNERHFVSTPKQVLEARDRVGTSSERTGFVIKAEGTGFVLELF